MPLKLNVGLSKKVGLPDYGSLGASCHVEVELESSLLQQDLQAFQQHVRRAYVACAQAVNDELARQQSPNSSAPGQPSSQETSRAAAPDNSHASQNNGNGTAGNGANGGHPASQKQLDFIQQLARQIRGLGVRRLDALTEKMFGKPLAALTSLDASSLIDMLKAIKEGRVDLEAALNGATT